MKRKDKLFQNKLEEIFSAEKPAAERLAEGYEYVLSRILAESEGEMEILRAMGNKAGLVKQQIKHSTIQHALEVFGECYFRATGELLQDRREG
ncbi:MAG: hypothetical protein JW757_00745 [Anaerolineales bacterium]|nr:hypothetical protein [Anaerolineales bacterium]